jgi:hypothetical protein
VLETCEHLQNAVVNELVVVDGQQQKKNDATKQLKGGAA